MNLKYDTYLENKQSGKLPEETWRQPEYALVAREVEDGFITRAYYVQKFGMNGLIRVNKPNMVYLVGQGLVANLKLRKVQDDIQVIGVGKSVGLYPKVRIKTEKVK